jgi:hypothetical protein
MMQQSQEGRCFIEDQSSVHQRSFIIEVGRKISIQSHVLKNFDGILLVCIGSQKLLELWKSDRCWQIFLTRHWIRFKGLEAVLEGVLEALQGQ